MKSLNTKINDSAYRKLMNLQRRKNYQNLGDLIAYLVKQQNKRDELNTDVQDSVSEKAGCDLSHNSASPGHVDLESSMKRTEEDRKNGKQSNTTQGKGYNRCNDPPSKKTSVPRRTL